MKRPIHRLNAILLITCSALVSTSLSARLWLPSDVEGVSLAVWYDASDLGTLSTTTVSGTNFVTQWDDKSGNSNHLSQAASELRLTTSDATEYINGLNTVVSVKATTNRMNTTMSIPRNTGNTALFWLARRDNSSGVDAIIQPSSIGSNNRFGINGGGRMSYRFVNNYLQWTFTTPSPSWGAGEVHIGEHYEESLQLYGGLDGKIKTGPDVSASGGASSAGWGFIPGESFSSTWDGAIAEIIIITNDAVPEAEREKFEGYLAHKWGIEANLANDHPYKDDPPMIASGSGVMFIVR